MVISTVLTTATVLPGSLLSDSALYTQLAGILPRGSVLVVLPAARDRQRQALELVAQQLQRTGHAVTTLVEDPHRQRGSLQAPLPLRA